MDSCRRRSILFFCWIVGFVVLLPKSLTVALLMTPTTFLQPSHSLSPRHVRVATTTITTRRSASVKMSEGEEGTEATRKSNNDDEKSLNGLRAGLVGGGPSGLLLAHKLIKQGATRVVVYERRPSFTLEGGRAYALGVGIRGRTAIKSADDDLWMKVKRQGFESQRFDLYTPVPFLPRFRLRDDKDAADGQDQVEPSLLLFQSSLCDALSRELTEREPAKTRLEVLFGTQVTNLDLNNMRITSIIKGGDDDNQKTTPRKESFDLIVGCDGVNSIVRDSMLSASRASNNDDDNALFNATVTTLPGEYKTVQSDTMPPLLDPAAVALLLPQHGGVATTAFVEPTSNGSCCILFAGSNSSEPLLSSTNVTELSEIIVERYPKLEGVERIAAERLASIRNTSTAKSVVCNTYHDGSVALIGDAAHATGGVSGQGVNSALADSAVLAQMLSLHYDPNNKAQSIQQALLSYSQQQVPEGAALYDLSFGPKPNSFRKRLRFLIKTFSDTVFKGKWGLGDLPLQTKLTTSTQSFSDIRRERDVYYDECFPKEEVWNRKITSLHEKMVAK